MFNQKILIEEYSIAQMTLEQIFNFFASQQEEETREIQGMVKKPEVKVEKKTEDEEMITILNPVIAKKISIHINFFPFSFGGGN